MYGTQVNKKYIKKTHTSYLRLNQFGKAIVSKTNNQLLLTSLYTV